MAPEVLVGLAVVGATVRPLVVQETLLTHPQAKETTEVALLGLALLFMQQEAVVVLVKLVEPHQVQLVATAVMALPQAFLVHRLHILGAVVEVETPLEPAVLVEAEEVQVLLERQRLELSTQAVVVVLVALAAQAAQA